MTAAETLEFASPVVGEAKVIVGGDSDKSMDHIPAYWKPFDVKPTGSTMQKARDKDHCVECAWTKQEFSIEDFRAKQAREFGKALVDTAAGFVPGGRTAKSVTGLGASGLKELIEQIKSA